MGAERLDTADPAAYMHKVRIDGQVLNVSAGSDGPSVWVSMDAGVKDTSLVDRVAARFDAALATGKYDAFFGK
jgi:hypothetical protein